MLSKGNYRPGTVGYVRKGENGTPDEAVIAQPHDPLYSTVLMTATHVWDVEEKAWRSIHEECGSCGYTADPECPVCTLPRLRLKGDDQSHDNQLRPVADIEVVSNGAVFVHVRPHARATLGVGLHAVYAQQKNAEPVEELTEEMIDAARPLFLALETGATSIEDVRRQISRGGRTNIDYLPEWFRTGSGHLTKAGRAIIVWHMMQHAKNKG